MTEESVCEDCGITFTPLPWANPNDLICDSCIEDILVKENGDEPWR